MAAFVTLIFLQYSMAHGRLIAPIAYDDIGYMADSAIRMRALYDSSLGGFVELWMAHPPHSPFSTLLCTVSFLMFGLHDWAPYVGNGLIVFAMLLFVDRLLPRLSASPRILCMFFICALPFTGMAIQEFRPDFPVAILNVLGIFTLISRPFIYGSRRSAVMAGTWFGLAMLTKPPMFPQTIILGFSAMGMAIICDAVGAWRVPRRRAIAGKVGLVLIPFLLIPLPHYCLALTTIMAYINEVLFGAYRDTYRYKGSFADHWLYYIQDVGGKTMLGRAAWPMIATLFSCFLLTCVLKLHRQTVRGAAMIVMTFFAYAIASANKTKQQFFGLTFDLALTISIMLMMGRFIASRGRFRACALAIMIFLVAFEVRFLQWPVRNGNAQSGWQVQRKQLVQATFDTLVSHSTFGGDPNRPLADPAIPESAKNTAQIPVILFCGIGDFNPDMLTYMAAQRQVHFDSIWLPTTTRLEEYMARLPEADYIFCAQEDTRLFADFLPMSPLVQPLYDAVRKDPRFVEIGKFTFINAGTAKDGTKASMFLFQRKPGK